MVNILKEMKIDVFGIVETKLNYEKFEQLRSDLGIDYEIIHNSSNKVDERLPIIMGWRKNNWSGTMLFKCNQLLQCQLTNIGGYSFDLLVVMGIGMFLDGEVFGQQLNQ